MIIFVSNYYFYFFEPNEKLKLLGKIEIRKLSDINFFNESNVHMFLCFDESIKTDKNSDKIFLIEIYKQQNFVQFLKDSFRSRELKPFTTFYSDHILMKT